MEEKIRLLIVDDDELVLDLMKHVARRVNRIQIEVTTVSERAIDWIRSRPQPYHLVLTDLVMPQFNGLDVLLAARMRSPDTRGIVVTGFADQQSLSDAIKLGVQDYLRKPFRREELDLTLRRAIEHFDIRARLAERTRLVEQLRSESEKQRLLEEGLLAQAEEIQARLAEHREQNQEESKLERVLTQSRRTPADKNQFVVMRQLQDLGRLYKQHQINDEELHTMRKALLERVYSSIIF